MRQYTNRCVQTALFGLLAIVRVSLNLAADEVDLIEEIAAAEAVRIGSVAQLLELPAQNRDGALRTDELAWALLQRTALAPNLGLTLTDHPRYAVRLLRDLDLLPPAAREQPAGAPLDGATALRVIGRTLEAGAIPTQAAHARSFLGARPARDAPWLEWDLSVAGGVSLDDEDRRGEADAALDLAAYGRDTVSGEVRIVARGSSAAREDLRLERALVIVRLESEPGSGVTTLALGRTPLPDRAGPALDLDVDGAALTRVGPRAVFYLDLGTGGMIPTERFPLALTLEDARNARSRPLGPGDYAPWRLVGRTGVIWPEAWGRQSPALEAAAIVDEATISGDAESDRLDLALISAGLSGSLGLRHFYDLTGALSLGRYAAADLGREDREYLGWLGRADLRWYPSGRSRSIVGLGILTASGGDDATSTLGLSEGSGLFRGLPPLPVALPWSLYEGGLTNVAALELRYSMRPFDPLLVTAASTLIARMTDGATGDAEIDPERSGRLVGLESSGSLRVRPIRDLIVELNGSIFLPVAGDPAGAYAAGTELRSRIELSLTARL